ncbi:aminotransferase class I/II-fold pyridoxal phosphate-dependent enzyme [Pseudomonadota bacterium]
MKIAPFETEQFFARHEFSTPYQLCNSDCESLSIAELLALAGESPEQLGRQRLGYTESRGNPELRRSIASLHTAVNAEDVVMLGTPVEGIYLVARSLLDPGDEVIVLTPAYDALINMFEHVVGAKQVRRWKIMPTTTSWELDLDDLRRLITPKTRLVVVNFPHNPTGYLPAPGFQQELTALIGEHGLKLFSDEMYFGLVQEGTAPIPSAADLTKNAIALSGLSKTYGLPGLRSGWLIVRDEAVRENIMNWKFYTSICPPGPSEYLAQLALRAGKTLRDRNVARIAQNIERADAFFARWPDLFRWRRPSAGSTALVGYDVPSVSAVSERLAQEEGVLIQSACMLGAGDQHMRIGLGRDNFAVGLGKFEDWLKR